MAKRSALTSSKVNAAYDTLVLLQATVTPEQRELIKQVRELLAQNKLFTPL